MTHNEIWLDFCVWNFEDVTPDEITSWLQIQPSRTYIKGEPKRGVPGAAVWKSNGWRFSATEDKQVPFDDQLEIMLDVIESKKDKFKAICDKYECEFSLGLYCYTNREESTPSVHLSKRYHKVTGDLNIEFDIDIILLEE